MAKAEQGAPSARFTPGPWIWSGGAILGAFGVYRNEHVLWPLNAIDAEREYGPLSEANYRLWWATTLGACGLNAEENAPQNAMLLAAAPELYEALRGLLVPLGPDGYLPTAGEPATNAARAALAKAEGRGASNG